MAVSIRPPLNYNSSILLLQEPQPSGNRGGLSLLIPLSSCLDLLSKYLKPSRVNQLYNKALMNQ